MLHFRIHGFLRTKLSLRHLFQGEAFHLTAAMETQRLANILKEALSPFAPL